MSAFLSSMPVTFLFHSCFEIQFHTPPNLYLPSITVSFSSSMPANFPIHSCFLFQSTQCPLPSTHLYGPFLFLVLVPRLSSVQCTLGCSIPVSCPSSTYVPNGHLPGPFLFFALVPRLSNGWSIPFSYPSSTPVQWAMATWLVHSCFLF
jgi:hypothetical protein